VVGLGEFRPIQSNATASGRNANRRVVLVILGTEGGGNQAVGTEGRASNTDNPKDDHRNGADSEKQKPALSDLSVLR
jgi:chemotaxis protein MotB